MRGDAEVEVVDPPLQLHVGLAGDEEFVPKLETRIAELLDGHLLVFALLREILAHAPGRVHVDGAIVVLVLVHVVLVARQADVLLVQWVEPLRKGAPEHRLVRAALAEPPVLHGGGPRVPVIVIALVVRQLLHRRMLERAPPVRVEHGPGRFVAGLFVLVRLRGRDVRLGVLQRHQVEPHFVVGRRAPEREARVRAIGFREQTLVVLKGPRLSLGVLRRDLPRRLAVLRPVVEVARELVRHGGLELAVWVVVEALVELGVGEAPGERAQAVPVQVVAARLSLCARAVVDRVRVPRIDVQLELGLVDGRLTNPRQVRVGHRQQRRHVASTVLRCNARLKLAVFGPGFVVLLFELFDLVRLPVPPVDLKSLVAVLFVAVQPLNVDRTRALLSGGGLLLPLWHRR